MASVPPSTTAKLPLAANRVQEPQYQRGGWSTSSGCMYGPWRWPGASGRGSLTPPRGFTNVYRLRADYRDKTTFQRSAPKPDQRLLADALGREVESRIGLRLVTGHEAAKALLVATRGGPALPWKKARHSPRTDALQGRSIWSSRSISARGVRTGGRGSTGSTRSESPDTSRSARASRARLTR